MSVWDNKTVAAIIRRSVELEAERDAAIEGESAALNRVAELDAECRRWVGIWLALRHWCEVSALKALSVGVVGVMENLIASAAERTGEKG